MGSIYLPGTIDTPKKEIIRYEGGYIRTVNGILIGRYDDKYVYEGTYSLNIHYVGKMQFNYGYLRSSDAIFVIAHKEGYLSVGNNKLVAYFDGDMNGAIAAFIMAYTKGIIPSDTTGNNNSVPVTEKKITNGSEGGPAISESSSIGGIWILVLILFLIGALYTAFAIWIDVFTTPISAKSLYENSGALFPITSMVIGIIIAVSSKANIFEAFIPPFVIQIIIVGICFAVHTQSPIIGFVLGLIAATIASFLPFIIGMIIAYVIKCMR